MTAVPIVEARALGCRFGFVTVLAGLNLEVRPGEIVGVFGPNGAGKTTLLRILATLRRPTAGSVRLFGSDAFTAFGGGKASLRRRLGLLTHEPFLYPDLTATENLMFYARLYRLRDGRARTGELIAWAGLTGDAARPVRAYSRGMVQRLALARTRLHDPELLLLDEPFSGLDVQGVGAVERFLAELRAEGRTALLITHDVERGLRFADRVYILHGGRVAWESSGPTGPSAFAEAYGRVVGRARG